MSLGEKFHYLDDVRYLLRYLTISLRRRRDGDCASVPRRFGAASQDTAHVGGVAGLRDDPNSLAVHISM
ncbi:MAG: hypothetical protein IH877_08125 [Gemmatimonadetes bacterium]|nr:hypothetical protein [Gemmatimonadota bacterium]